MAEIRITNDLKKIDFSAVYNNYDPNFTGVLPDGDINGAQFLDNVPDEFKKLLNRDSAELQDIKFPVNDESS